MFTSLFISRHKLTPNHQQVLLSLTDPNWLLSKSYKRTSKGQFVLYKVIPHERQDKNQQVRMRDQRKLGHHREKVFTILLLLIPSEK